MVCAACKDAVYCNLACQGKHWQTQHSRVCVYGVPYPIETIRNDDFITSFFNTHERIIGKGGRGTVYANPDFEGVVVKASRIKDACRGNNEEYKTMQTIRNKLGAAGITYRHVQPIRSYSYLMEKVVPEQGPTPACYIVMDHVVKPARVVPPLVPDPDGTRTDAAFQVYLNSESQDALHLPRGEYIGAKETQAMMQGIELREVVEDLGSFIAQVHFVAEYDAGDLEYVLGYVRDELKIVALDYDLCIPIGNWDRDAIRRASWAMDAEEYVPKPGNDDLYPIFSEAYMKVAREAGREKEAELILAELS
jgi:hypothetical protein